MATTATAQDLAEARKAVEELETTVTDTRTALVRAALVDDVDRLAAELTNARRQARIARNILGDMEAGAGDFYADDDED